jgi:hypothetical protein
LRATTGLETVYRVSDARGVGLSADERRLYLAGRSPDSLLVFGISDPAGNFPVVRAMRAVSLPNAPSELKVLRRPGHGDLVLVSCTGAGVLAFYDDDVGTVVAQLPGLGEQPFGLAVDRRGDGARIFVSNFSDGRIAVVDLPDLLRPQEARIVAHLGHQQVCLTRDVSTEECLTVTGGTP